MRVRNAPLALALLLAGTPAAQDPELAPVREGPESWREALAGGETWIDARYRYEVVDDDLRPEEAHASTLRTRLGYRSASWRGWRGLFEVENVTALGNDLYDSTTNGETERGVVADPEGTEVDQAYLSWEPREARELWLGRRRITLDNHRFVGDVGWRQNDQTFDSAGFDWKPDGKTRVFAAFVHNVNRVFGDESPVGDARMRSLLLNASRSLAGAGRAVAYWYHLDVEAPSALEGFSTSTVGARLTGERALEPVTLHWTGELAHQSDVGDHPGDVDALYWTAELGASRGGCGLTLGYEVLEGSDEPGGAFSTPLATLHAFNGWADRFLVTPDGGIEDAWARLAGEHGALAWSVTWHEFQAETGGDDYGGELDASLGWRFGDGTQAGVKLASYDADEFSEDTTKLWIWLALRI